MHEYPATPTKPEQLRIDWTRTRAWAEGGYYGRVFVNIEGRELQGVVSPGDVDALTSKLAAELAEIPGPQGERVYHRIVTPGASYRRCVGLPPDLAVFFGDLDYRAIGSVGHRNLHTVNNDTGPDACNHDWDGIFVMHAPGQPARGELSGLQIYDVNATILALMGVTTDDDLLGRNLYLQGPHSGGAHT